MIHLTEADFIRQPWKNGRGTTVELWRLERDGQLLVRLSRAVVVEDGPFSIFPGVERNLTVLDGLGFRLLGEGLDLRCDPLVPVAFPGDVPVRAIGTQGLPSQDFNVMTARGLPRPMVRVLQTGAFADGGQTAIHPLQRAAVNGKAIGKGDLALVRGPVDLKSAGPVVVVTLPDLG
jgi:uncharacterized protein